MSIGKRFTSFMLSAVMIAGNMVSPITAYAGETEAGNTGQVQSETAAETTAGPVTAAATEVQPATDMPVPETEAKNYRLILPTGDGYSFTYDQNHFSEEYKEKKSVTLLYKAGDEVDLDLFAKDGYQLDKVSFTDKEKIDPQIDQLNVTYQEVSYTWKDEDTLIFTMPEKDIWMQTEFHQLQSETAAASESAQAMPDTSAQVSDAVQGNESPETSTGASSELSAIEQDGQTQEAGDASGNGDRHRCDGY